MAPPDHRNRQPRISRSYKYLRAKSRVSMRCAGRRYFLVHAAAANSNHPENQQRQRQQDRTKSTGDPATRREIPVAAPERRNLCDKPPEAHAPKMPCNASFAGNPAHQVAKTNPTQSKMPVAPSLAGPLPRPSPPYRSLESRRIHCWLGVSCTPARGKCRHDQGTIRRRYLVGGFPTSLRRGRWAHRILSTASPSSTTLPSPQSAT